MTKKNRSPQTKFSNNKKKAVHFKKNIKNTSTHRGESRAAQVDKTVRPIKKLVHDINLLKLKIRHLPKTKEKEFQEK